jgi:predicted aspartyl protease
MEPAALLIPGGRRRISSDSQGRISQGHPMISRHARVLLASAFLSTVLSVGANADECGPLKIIASVDMKTEPPDPRFYVPVALQGQQKYMLLDTGGGLSEITQGTVDSLGLSTHKSTIREFDVSGNYVDHVAVVPSFQIGTLSGQNVEFMVKSQIGPNNTEIAGLLAPNILRFYDLSADFGENKLTLLSQDHCEGKVIYWPATAVAVVSMTTIRMSGHITVPVMLDGQRLNAEIDTGASNTVLNLTIAEGNFGLDAKGSDMRPVTRLHNRNGDVVYRHTFKSLDFNGVAVSNPSIDIVPDLVEGQLRQTPTGTRLQDSDVEQKLPDLLIGADVLRHLHVYFAYKEQKLYITPTSVPEAPAMAATSGEAGKAAVAPATDSKVH